VHCDRCVPQDGLWPRGGNRQESTIQGICNWVPVDTSMGAGKRAGGAGGRCAARVV